MAKKRANGEGSIRRKPNGRWEGRYTLGIDPATGRAIQKSVSAKTRAECKEKLAKAIRARGAHFGLVVNPSTPVEALTPYLDEIEWVILMLVQPGFAGAKLIDGILDKVAAARRFLDEHGHPETEISVDGSVSCERARLMRDMGASIFVGGTAGIYRKGMTLDESIPLFRQAIK